MAHLIRVHQEKLRNSLKVGMVMLQKINESMPFKISTSKEDTSLHSSEHDIEQVDRTSQDCEIKVAGSIDEDHSTKNHFSNQSAHSCPPHFTLTILFLQLCLFSSII